MKFSEQLKDLFYFHESARRGILWLVLIMAACLVFRICFPLLRRNENPDNLLLYQNWMTSIQSAEGTPETDEGSSPHNGSIENPEITHKPSKTLFHPDTASVKTWMKYGLSRRQANTVVKYLNSGARLRSRKDLLKIKIIDTSTFDLVSPFLDLPDSLEKHEYINKISNSEARTLLIIDINLADTSAFKSLPGIGSYFAGKIVEYRSRLGGFCSVHQISEVKGLKPETFELIRPHMQLQEGTWDVIDINGFDEKLFSHPYLNKTQIRTLAAWREKHGPYVSADQVKQAAMLSDSEINRLLPYLPF